MSYHKKYYQKNKSKILARNRLYRERFPWYDCWRNAHARCEDPRNKNFARLNAAGIKCTLTKRDVVALWSRDQAHLLNTPSIDRINPNKDYTFSNCRFIEFYDNVSRRHNPDHVIEVVLIEECLEIDRKAFDSFSSAVEWTD